MRQIYLPGNNMKHFIYLKLMAYKIIQACTGDHGLDIMNTFQKIILPAAIKLRQNIIQKKYRLVMNDFFHQINF